MINAKSVSFSYGAAGDAVSAVSLNVAKGGLWGLAGANGSGKSTLLSLIAGLYTPDQGTLMVADRRNPGQERSIRGVCRMVMQDADLQILGGTVGEDMLIGRSSDATVVDGAKRMAERFNLLDAWERPVQSLSWGMKRKLCLATALLDSPSVLLLDEPFSGLDYFGIKEMRAILVENKRCGLTQVVSSHDLESFIDLVDALAVMDGGSLVLSGPPEAVLDQVLEHGVRPPCSWIAGRAIVPWSVAG